ncbi:L-lactate permease [Micrococcus sp. FDAARGOS_333]|uniref:L-lactate permease n=1 Tax=Micrococcus sp. FDAARGOS_333 TaxID=1930558 RepID=UPI000B4E5339|nr:L-lactate permease [Micrococcus sp. FDAARGOS_333]PNL16888.1 L-lactate permease [Micrococcus sp. FDAARGOS_333]
MLALLACVPVLLTLILLTRPLPGWVAPAAGAASALLLGATVLGTDAAELTAPFAKGWPILLEVLAIMAGGITLARVMERGGGHAALGRWLSGGTGPGLASALMMVHGVVPFLESVTGFGVAVIVCLPLLTTLGFTPFRAACLALLGLSVNPWGSMAPGALLGAQLTGLDFRELGIATAVFNVIPAVTAGVAAALIVRGSRADRHRGVPLLPRARLLGRWLPVAVASAVVYAGLVLGANILLGTPPAGATAGLLMALAWRALIGRRAARGARDGGPGAAGADGAVRAAGHRGEEDAAREGAVVGKQGLPVRELAPYLVLMAGTIAGTAAHAALPLGALGPFVRSPATWALLGAAIGLVVLHLDADRRRLVGQEVVRLWVATAIPTALYIAFGYALTGGGLADEMARALGGLGGVFLWLSPFVAGLSGYVTASTTGANAMFAPLQASTAQALGVSPLWLTGMHSSAASWAVVACPARIELASRLAGAEHREDTPGLLPTRRNLLAVMAPTVLVVLVAMAAVSALLLPLGAG